MLLHNLLLKTNQGTRRLGVRIDILGLVEAGPDENAHLLDGAEFHSAHLQYLGAE